MMQVRLNRGQSYQTPSGKDAYKLREGSANIFIVPEEKGIFGRPLHIMTAQAKMTVPGLYVTDDDYVTWRLQIEATEDCELQIIEKAATRPLQSRFIERADIPMEEGMRFEQAMIERYVSEIISEDVFIFKSEQARQREREQSLESLRRAAEAIPAEEEDLLDGKAEDGKAARGGSLADWLRRCRDIFAATELRQKRILLSVPCLLALMGILLVWITGRMFEPAAAQRGLFALGCCLLLPGYLALRGWLEKYRLAAADRIAQTRQEKRYEALFCGMEEEKDPRAAAMDLLFEFGRNSRVLQDFYGAIACLIPALGCWIFLLWKGWPIALVPGALTLAVCIILALGRSSAGRTARIAGQKRGEADADLRQFLGNMEKVRLSGAREYILRRYYDRVEKSKGLEQAAWRSSLGGRTWMSLLTGAAVMATAFWIVSDSGPREGMAAMVAGSLLMILEGLRGTEKLVRFAMTVKRNPETLELLSAEAEDVPKPSAEDEPRSSEILQLERVSFGYDDTPVLRDISLCVREGEFLGIAGASGCGKSTLLRILAGMTLPDEGILRWKGTDINARNRSLIRSEAGIVLQNDQLMNGSIRENILAGTEDIDKRAFRNAVEMALLADDAAEMPMGYETLISEQTETISAGQKQKILLARALVRHPRILFLDEAESELDQKTQERIHENIRETASSGIIVSHHFRSLSKCDRIIVLNQGRIDEEGTPEELLRKKGLFFTLMKRQL